MAQQQTSDISSAIATLFQNDVRETFNRTAATLSTIKCVETSGQKVTWDAYLVDNTPGSIYVAEGTGVPTVNNADAVLKAELDFARCVESFGITDLAAAKSGTTSNPSGLGDLAKRGIRMAAQRMFSKMNSEAFVGAGTGTDNKFVGLSASALLDSGTYAGLARGTYAKWKAYLNANGGTPRAISDALVRDVITNIRVATGQNPDLIVMHPAQRAKLAATPTYFQPVAASNDGSIAKGGAVYMFDGVKILEDKDAPTDKVLFLNTGDVQLVQLPQAQGLPYLTMENGLRIYVEKLAADGSGDRYALKAFAQVQAGQPNTCGMLVDLS